MTMKYEVSEYEGNIVDSEDNNVYVVLGSTLTDIANSIRKITGTSEKVPVKNFSKILNTQANSFNVPELNTLTWEIVSDNEWFGDGVDTTLLINYIGIDETNTIKNQTIEGKTGTIQYIPKSYINICTQSIDDGVYPDITNITEENEQTVGYYVGETGADHSMVIIDTLMFENSKHLKIFCSTGW